MDEKLIAPCGMNCGICNSYLALVNDLKSKGIMSTYCAGCRPRDKKCAFLKKRCHLLMSEIVQYCYECEEFPCLNLQHIDERYRTLYRMSMVENLRCIREEGMAPFLEKQREKWRCPKCGGIISCHNGICYSCEADKLKDKKTIYRWEDG